jgi:hypothetical protein
MILSVGLILPWLTGIGVKLYLDVLGSPTLKLGKDVSFESLLFIISATIWWGIGYIALAFFAHRLLSALSFGLIFRLSIVVILCAAGLMSIVLGRLYEGIILIILSFPIFRVIQLPSLGLHSYHARMLLILCGFLGGAIGTIHTFFLAWSYVESVFYGFFVFPIICLPYMLGGLLVGYLAGKAVDEPSKEESGS